MTAKLTLIGQPQHLRISGGIAAFTITTGPASNTAPKGLTLFKAVTYRVECSERQFNRGRAEAHDKSELILEGYLEPRVDETGKPYIAVVALSVTPALVLRASAVQVSANKCRLRENWSNCARKPSKPKNPTSKPVTDLATSRHRRRPLLKRSRR